jgi:glyoxylase-like metal-dependent hydrolase (beta-lactamase superfamily II)
MTLPVYEVFAIKYAERPARRPDNFIGGDPHEGAMPMDYFVWLIRNDERVIVVDTGFDAAMAAKRKRTLVREPRAGLALLGVDAAEVRDVIITHLHNDHIGTFFDFPAARFHLQDEEMEFVTGRYMRHEMLRRPYEVEHVVGVVRMVFKDRVEFHRGDGGIAPGVSVHHIGGHTMGLQAVRVHTRRGWVVLASDASHYYEHMENARCFPLVFDVAEMLAGFDTLRRQATSPRHIIPGHDPLVLQRYPAVSPELAGIAVRLDADPVG